MSGSDVMEPPSSFISFDSHQSITRSSGINSSLESIASSQFTNSSTTLSRNELVDHHPLINEQENISPIEKMKSAAADNLKKKKVTFPEDGSVIMGYMEPPCHWSQVSSCTTEELIEAYRASCFHHRVNPQPSILEQLKGINPHVCNERYEMLSLKGQKFSLRDMETIEQILRRVQFQTLDFEGTNLDDEMAIGLFDMVEYYESCTKLNISNNPRITPRGYQSCSRMLKRTPCLEVLILRNTLFLDASLPVLARSIRMGSSLRQLHLDHCNVCGRNLLVLVSALKVNETIRELSLIGNNLMPTDGIQLGALLKFNRNLRVLDVRNNCLGDVGTSHLCDGLFEQTLKTGQGSLVSSSFSSTNNESIYPQGGGGGGLTSSFNNSISSSESGLETLILWNNGFTHLAMIAMAQALRRCAFLQALNLGCNPLGSEGAHALREGLLYNRSLTRLWLPACKITCEGAVALAEVIADTRKLQRIDLRENDIRTGGLMALAHALKLNDSVTRIDLDLSAKKEPNMRDYQQTQRECLDRIMDCLKANQLKAERLAEEQAKLNAHVEGLDDNDVDIVVDINNKDDDDLDKLTDEINPTATATTIPAPTSIENNAIRPSDLSSEDGERAAINSSSIPSSSSSSNLTEEIVDELICNSPLANKIHSPTDDLLANDIEFLFQVATEAENIVNNSTTCLTSIQLDDNQQQPQQQQQSENLNEEEEELNAEIAALPLTQRLKLVREACYQHQKEKQIQQNLADNSGDNNMHLFSIEGENNDDEDEVDQLKDKEREKVEITEEKQQQQPQSTEQEVEMKKENVAEEEERQQQQQQQA